MKLVPGGAVEQTEMALKNLEAVLKAADSGVDKVIKNTVFLKDLNDFGAVNEVYKRGKELYHGRAIVVAGDKQQGQTPLIRQRLGNNINK